MERIQGEMNRETVSIIIPTRDRKDSLKEVLDSIGQFNYPKEQFEVIVVDDGSADGTGELVRKLQTQSPFKVQYYRQERKGLSAAKNLGIRNAAGSLLVFTDDDCIVEKDWLNKLLKAFDSPEMGVVGGPDRIPLTSSFLAKCIDFSVTSFVGTGGVREGKTLRLATYYPRGCNTAVRKSAIEAVRGFDEDLKTGEDIELIFRIKQAGYSIQYAADAFVWHKRRDSIRTFLRQIYSRGYWRMELGRRHRELLEFSYLFPSAMVVGFTVLLGLSFLFPPMVKGLVLLTGLYLLILVSGGIQGALKIGDLRAVIVIPLLLILQHITYGLGFLRALKAKSRV